MRSRLWKRLVRPLVPVGLIERRARQLQKIDAAEEVARRQRFDVMRDAVGKAMAAVSELTEQQCSDAVFLENEFIPLIGLNDEHVDRQPPEFSESFGTGLHIWQYANQLAGYLVWLSKNVADITSYMEIGCRWGGMFILISEWIRKNGGQLRKVVAVDLIPPTPFIETYFELLRAQSDAGRPKIETIYIQDLSTSATVKNAVEQIQPDLVFIDADHSLRGALGDHMLVRKSGKVIVHHDICSQRCVDTTFLWQVLKQLEEHEFDFFEFVDQYRSVKGRFLGIGVMKRKR